LTEGLIRDWVDAANEDLMNAQILFRHKSYKGCVYHCHQAVEKMLKAIIIKNGMKINKIHDLISLSEKTGLEFPIEITEFIDSLSPHYLPSKYPDVGFKFNYNKRNSSVLLKKTKEVFKWLKSISG